MIYTIMSFLLHLMQSIIDNVRLIIVIVICGKMFGEDMKGGKENVINC